MPGPVRPAPRDLRRLHRVGPQPRLHRGLHPPRGAAALRQHPHRGQRHRPADHPAARGRPPIIRDARRRRRRRPSSSSPAPGSTAAIDKLDRHPRPAHPGRPRRPLPPDRRRSRRASGPSSSSDPSSTTPTSCPGASRSPTSSPSARTPTATSTRPSSRPSSCGTPTGRCEIGSFSAASNVTGIVSDTYGIAALLHAPRRPVLLGLRRRARRTSTSRCTRRRRATRTAYKDAIFLSPHKFIGGPGTPGVLVVRRELLTQPGARRARRRHGELRQPRRAPLPRRPRAPRGGRHPRDRRVDPRGPGVPAQGRPSAPPPSRHTRSDLLAPRRARLAGTNPAIEILGNRDARAAVHRVASWCARRAAATCTTTSSSPCSTTSSASRPAAAAPAPGPYGHRLLHIDLEQSHRFERRDRGGCEGIKPGWVRVNFNYFVADEVVDYIIEAVRHGRPRWLAAARRLHLRPGQRPVAPPRRAT